MPVIRGDVARTAVSPERRNSLLQVLSGELSGEGRPGGPVIFEIPLDESGRIDVLVVWQEFQGLRSEDRSSLIEDAYGSRQGNIAQALGVTFQEAIEQHLLPYAVVPMVRQGEVDAAELRAVMLAEGGFPEPQNKVNLRFPTMAMAETVHRRLCDKLPRGYWSIEQAMTSSSSGS